ncbi:MAG: hypothetical protein HQ582_15830 [Planctomycetes bacterium]|nr:hypothetical protein [Planctomycetota bacterium]
MSITLDHVLSHFRASPEGKRIVADAEAAELAERKTHVKAIAEAEAELKAALPGLTKAFDQADKGVKAAEAALLEAHEVRRRAYGEQRNAIVRHDRERGQHQDILAASSSPEIDEFISWTRDEWTRSVAHDRQWREEDSGKVNGRTLKPIPKFFSNKPGHERYLAGLREASDKAEQLKHTATADIGKAIEKIRAAIPHDLQMVEV